MSAEPDVNWFAIVFFLIFLAIAIPVSAIPTWNAMQDCKDGGTLVRGMFHYECIQEQKP